MEGLGKSQEAWPLCRLPLPASAGAQLPDWGALEGGYGRAHMPFLHQPEQLWPRSTFVLILTMVKESTDTRVDPETAAPVLGNKGDCFLIVVKLAIGSIPSPAICWSPLF